MNFLILPGWCLPSDTYRNLKRLLEKKGHRVYVADFPGFKKKLTQPLHLNNYVEFIRDYISQNNISRPVIIGHSFGGRVALRLLSTYPSTASPVILTGVPGYRSDSSLKISLFKLIAKTGKPIARFLFSGGLLSLFSKVLYMFAGNFDYYRADPLLKETFHTIVNDSLVHDIETVKAETFLVWGKEDVITPLWIGQKMVKNMKNAHLLVVEEAGHNFPYKDPDKFVAALDTIVRQYH